MTWKITIRGSADRPIAAEYCCPVHGRFTVTVDRDAKGDAPSEVRCTHKREARMFELFGATPEERIDRERCYERALFVLSAPRVSVRRIEVERGGWEKPARKTFLDTRDLGEGQDVDEWRAKREAIRDQQRRDSLKELIDG